MKHYLIASLPMLLAACNGTPTVERSQGEIFPLEPLEQENSMLFAGEAESISVESARSLAQERARKAAIEYVSVDVKSEIQSLVRESQIDDVVSYDQNFLSLIETSAKGSLKRSKLHGKPYLEFLSNGRVRARLRIEVPKKSLDADLLLGTTLESQAIAHRGAGQLDKAINVFQALSQLQPSNPVPHVHIARIEEQRLRDEPSARAKALEQLRIAKDRNEGRARCDLGKAGIIDLDDEIDRLTPHWAELLDTLARYERETDKSSLRVSTSNARYSRKTDKAVTVRIYSQDERAVALLWIDADGLFPYNPPPDLSILGSFGMIKGRSEWSLNLGTPGSVRLVALSIGRASVTSDKLPDIAKADVDARKKSALDALQSFRNLLRSESENGTLRVTSRIIEVIP